MLKLKTNNLVKLIYDFELGPTEKFVVCTRNNPFMSDLELTKFCPNVQFLDTYNVEEIIQILYNNPKTTYLALNQELFQSFVYSWLKPYIDNYQEWYSLYIQTIKDFNSIDEDYTELDSFFRYHQKYIIDELEPLDLVKEYNINLEPELSIKLQYWLNKGEYKDDIFKEVSRNQKEYDSILKYWSSGIKIINFNNFYSKSDLMYITQPFSLERVQTNYRYIKEKLLWI